MSIADISVTIEIPQLSSDRDGSRKIDNGDDFDPKPFRLTTSIECSRPCVGTDTKRHAFSRSHPRTAYRRYGDLTR
jgi:hypothetical protein